MEIYCKQDLKSSFSCQHTSKVPNRFAQRNIGLLGFKIGYFQENKNESNLNRMHVVPLSLHRGTWDMLGNSPTLMFGKRETLTIDGVASDSTETEAGSNRRSSEQAEGCCICLVAITWRQDATFCWLLPSRRMQLCPLAPPERGCRTNQLPLLMEMTCSFHVAWQHFCLKALKFRRM